MHDFQVPMFVWIIVIGVLVNLCARILYNLLFHQLAKFPGPKLYAISGIFFSWENFVIGKGWKRIRPLHDQYGKIVRLGPNSLSIDTSVIWEDVYGHKLGGKAEFERYRPFVGGDDRQASHLINARKEDHRRQRRLLAHAFSEQALGEQEGLMIRHIDMLISQLHERADSQDALDISEWFNFATFDVIGDLAFGEPFDCLAKGRLHPWAAMTLQYLIMSSMMKFILQYPLLAAATNLVAGRRMIEKAKEHTKVSVLKADRRMAHGVLANNRKDFMYYILRHNDAKGMTKAEIYANAPVLVAGGGETTATALTGLMFMLACNPQWHARLTEEVRSTFASEKSINVKSVTRLKYMHACVEEALRLYPPTPELPTRISPGGVVNNDFIPPGTLIFVSTISGFRSSESFQDATEYKPERWLPTTDPLYNPKYSNDKLDTVKPFGFGPQNCIGQNLAYSEIRLILARLLYTFDWTLEPGQSDWLHNQKVFNIWDKAPLYVRIQGRGRSA